MKTITTDGIQVFLTVDGEALEEYDDEDSTRGNIASKYVEVAEGAPFAVEVLAEPGLAPSPEDCLNVRISLDGKFVIGQIWTLHRNRYQAMTRTIEGRDKNTSRGVVMERFQFAHLQTNDGPLGKQKLEDFKNLGEVRVDCHFARKKRYLNVKPDDARFESAFGSNVPEKCLKGRAISHHATLGHQEIRPGPMLTYADVDYPYGKDPLATYKFKYRSRRDLQIEGIIERSPTPVPLEDRDPDDLTPEEARELVRRLQQRQREQASVKQEVKREKRARSLTVIGDEYSDDEEVTVTNAGPSRKRNRHSDDSGIEIVDLTED